MSLQQLQSALQKIDAVSRTKLLTETNTPILKVSWSENPYNYSEQLSKIRDAYPNISQVNPPNGHPKKTSDAMPVTYYANK